MKIQRCNYLEENQMAIIEDMDTLIHNITSSELKEKNIKITKLQQELQRKDNIIKDIKEFIEWHYKDNQEFYKNKGIGLNYPEVDYILDKIKEVESK